MSQYLERVVGRPKNIEVSPFGLSLSGGSQYISSGICFSTFSYSLDKAVPIDGIETPFKLEKDHAVYIDFSILPNLQVSGAYIAHAKVGKDAPATGWKSYPDQYVIKPYEPVDGRKQEKYYLMLGKCSEKKPTKSPYKIFSITGGSPGFTGTFYYEQYVNTNMFTFINQISGVPILFTMPYFGGSYSQ